MRIVREAQLWMERNRNALFYPVGRVLMACTAAYLAGIVCAAYWSMSAAVACLFCMSLLIVICCLQRTGRRILIPVCMIILVIGNCRAGYLLDLSDEATAPNTPISGTVVRIEMPYRVMLGDVLLPDGRKTNRSVVVTLMNDDESALPDSPKIGQRVSGNGRLFAQDEVRNPGGADQRLRALCRGYDLSGYLLPGWNANGEESFSLNEVFRRMRLWMAERLECLFPGESALFAALMLGVTDDVDAELSAAMRLTGTAHILSVSGMHLTMVSGALYALLRLLPIGRKAAYAIQAAAMLLFSGVTGFAVGTVRALLMQYLAMLARLTGRRYDSLTALSFSALAITVFYPLMVFDAGFQFSFFVVLGIHLLMGPVQRLAPLRWLHEKVRWLAEMVSVSICAQLAALPIQLSLYGYVPLLSLPMNLLCSVVTPLIMIGGWCVLALSMLLPALPLRAAGLLSYAAGMFEAASLYAAQIRGGILRLPAPGRSVLPLFGFSMALVSEKVRFGRWRYRAFAAAMLIMAVLYIPKLNPAPRYVQIDVGQGDASLIRSGRHAVVIDAGPAYSYDLLRYLRHEGLIVDALVLSHLDEDHAGAMSVLCSSEVGVERVIMAQGAQEDVSSDEVLRGLTLLDEQGIDVEFVEKGDEFSAMEMTFHVLSPDPLYQGSNERSLLLSVRAGKTDILLTGDLPIDCEPDTVHACDILKVAHHGSRNASSPEFLSQASPQIAIISCGKNNSYGHPHERVLEDLKDLGADVIRTDQSGCITVWLGDEVKVDTFL